MKKLINALSFFTIIALFSQFTFSQSNFNCAKFINSTNGVLCADNGFVQLTTDGGASWLEVNTGFTNNLYCIHQLDEINFLAIGAGGLVIKSTDGGATWTQRSSGVSSDLRSMDMAMNITNSGTAFNIAACGDNGTIIYSVDMGDTWSEKTSATAVNLNCILFKDAVTCFAVGNSSTILRSDDSGISWVLIVIPSGVNDNNFKSIAFNNEHTNGMIVGDNEVIYVSSSGGDGWNITNNVSSGIVFQNVKYSNTDDAVIVGQAQTILKTTDNGTTWLNINLGQAIASELYSLNFTSKFIGVAVGSEYTKLYTADGGFTWQTTYSGSASKNVVNKTAEKIELNQNYPNPFNPSTTIGYSLSFDANVSVKIYDLAGREVATLVNSFQNAGSYRAVFNASNLSSGVYFYKFTAVNNNNRLDKTMRMILTK